MKKIAISSFALFVASMLLGFVIHGMLLQGDYDASGIMRPLEQQESMFPIMLLAHVMIAVGFTLIYRRGRQDKPWLGQGIRFGLLWAVFPRTSSTTSSCHTRWRWSSSRSGSTRWLSFCSASSLPS